ncbi:MAG TPA: glycosyltransferase family 4 protein [Candidatus Paceibacterota bacterium]
MKLLIITQKVDASDDVLGFFIEWIRKLAGKAEQINVICLFKGEYDLPDNVNVFSLGKEEKGTSKLKYLKRFYEYIWKLRNNYDSVFVHMNPKYVVLGALFWKIWEKKIVLWYAHGHTPPALKLADKLTDIAVASTPEGYRVLGTNKLKVIGQGIDTERFKPIQGSRFKVQNSFKVVSVGRITPSKDYETLIKASEILKDDGAKFQVEIAGQPATGNDIEYMEKLKKTLENKKMTDMFQFIGPIVNKDLPPFLRSADLFVNMSHTGSLDKAILEAMACGLPVLTCNEALKSVLGEYSSQLMYSKRDDAMLAERIDFMMKMPIERKEIISSDMRKIVVKNHSIDGFIDKLSKILKHD